MALDARPRRLPPPPGWVNEEKIDGWREKQLRGLVAKEASPYVGGRTRAWLKVKVPGWTDAEDRWRRVITSRTSH